MSIFWDSAMAFKGRSGGGGNFGNCLPIGFSKSTSRSALWEILFLGKEFVWGQEDGVCCREI